jgi:hypothetical protein
MKKMTLWLVAMVLFAATPRFPADSGKLSRWSLIAMWFSASADVSTSLALNGQPQYRETNPLIGPRFGARGIALEFGSRAPVTGAELLLMRRHKERHRYFAAENFGLSTASSVATIGNSRLQRAKAPRLCRSNEPIALGAAVSFVRENGPGKIFLRLLAGGTPVTDSEGDHCQCPHEHINKIERETESHR